MKKLLSFTEITEKLKEENKTSNLLLGNGFSCAYNNEIFNYKYLNEFIKKDADEVTQKILSAIKDTNIENTMLQIENFQTIANILLESHEIKDEVIDTAEKAIDNIKQQFLAAIKDLHPDNASTLYNTKAKSCFQFINKVIIGEKGNIFSTNYDLLLYWVLMRNSKDNDNKFCDGFGRYEYDPKELVWGPNKDEQNIFYLHGALHLFNDAFDITKLKSTRNNPIIKQVTANIETDKYPIMVSSGTKEGKVKQITSSSYLKHCYDALSHIEDNLVIFGFSFGDNDDHITEAIANAIVNGKLHNVYIGVFSDDDIPHFDNVKKKIDDYVSQKAKHRTPTPTLKYSIEFYNSQDVHIWDSKSEETNDSISDIDEDKIPW